MTSQMQHYHTALLLPWSYPSMHLFSGTSLSFIEKCSLHKDIHHKNYFWMFPRIQWFATKLVIVVLLSYVCAFKCAASSVHRTYRLLCHVWRGDEQQDRPGWETRSIGRPDDFLHTFITVGAWIDRNLVPYPAFPRPLSSLLAVADPVLCLCIILESGPGPGPGLHAGHGSQKTKSRAYNGVIHKNSRFNVPVRTNCMFLCS